MSTNYSIYLSDVKMLDLRLEACAQKLNLIQAEERYKYENPQYRLWSGDPKDLEEFVSRLEEWLNQPAVAESKRFVMDLKKWAGPSEKSNLEEIEKDGRFLSDNLEEIRSLHDNIGHISHEKIKREVTAYVLQRLVEKDTHRAKMWSINAFQFSTRLAQFEQEEAKCKLSSELKKDAVKLLLKENSFDTDNGVKIVKYAELETRAENIVRNKPEEISEEAILNSYHKSKGIDEALSAISFDIDNINRFLIELEWIKEFPSNSGYNQLWSRKTAAMKKSDLESMRTELDIVSQQVKSWKSSRQKEIENTFMQIERMQRHIEKERIANIEDLKQKIDWNKPNINDIFDTFSKTNELKDKLKGNLIGKLGNEDAISIIEETEIIEDLGKSKGWEFERFMKALEIVLSNGLLTIKAAEEK